jgi:hypothetical protein
MKSGPLFVASLFSLFVASYGYAQNPQTIEGVWFGSLATPDGVHCWLSNRQANGTYKTDFISQDGDLFKKYWQAGTWRSDGGTFTTEVREENGVRKPSDAISYAIVSLTNDVLVYRHIGSSTRFSVKRVGADFKLPERCGKVDA